MTKNKIQHREYMRGYMRRRRFILRECSCVKINADVKPETKIRIESMMDGETNTVGKVLDFVFEGGCE